MRTAVTVLCIALTIALAVVGLWLWQAHERKVAHIDWLMKKYLIVHTTVLPMTSVQRPSANGWLIARSHRVTTALLILKRMR